ncbi:MAG: methionyl-tRNA synthetase [Patescibacteria group bacterium]|nr:methionyl-tRNA synthetase [Patescibacteria group bacterium]
MTRHLITTAIDYVNASPHAGHALEKIQADVLSRYYRSLGDEVFFLTGTDENSLKNVQSAEKEGLPVKEFVERNAKQFMRLAQELNLSNDDFIRTTETRHTLGVQKLWQACLKDIYKKTYQGLYCVGCEEFYKEDELVNGLCPEHKTKPELISEEDYFFRLSKYQHTLSELISSNQLEIIPESRKNEVLNFINSGLEDICISRSTQRAHHWGIDVPNDSNQKVWVWFDALSNYITALGYATESEQFKKWWLTGEDLLHCIGKGISRFHAVYWPAMLLSAGLPLPKRIFVHGYLTVKGEKMAKSLGNIVDPFQLLDKYGSEVVRYFFIREFSATEDGNFSEERIQERYQSDLAEGLGNLLSRVLALGEKYHSPILLEKNELLDFRQKIEKQYQQKMQEFKFNEALASVWDLVNALNKYLTDKKPWKTITNNPKEFEEQLATLVLSLGKVALLIAPVMPETSEKILEALQLKNLTETNWHNLKVSLKTGIPLFPKL